MSWQGAELFSLSYRASRQDRERWEELVILSLCHRRPMNLSVKKGVTQSCDWIMNHMAKCMMGACFRISGQESGCRVQESTGRFVGHALLIFLSSLAISSTGSMDLRAFGGWKSVCYRISATRKLPCFFLCELAARFYFWCLFRNLAFVPEPANNDAIAITLRRYQSISIYQLNELDVS